MCEVASSPSLGLFLVGGGDSATVDEAREMERGILPGGKEMDWNGVGRLGVR